MLLTLWLAAGCPLLVADGVAQLLSVVHGLPVSHSSCYLNTATQKQIRTFQLGARSHDSQQYRSIILNQTKLRTIQAAA